MAKREFTQAERDYRRYCKLRDKLIKELGGGLLWILVGFVWGFQLKDETAVPLMVIGGIFVLYVIFAAVVGRRVKRTGDALRVAAYGEETEVDHEGLFGELWDEFEWNQYEGLIDGKLVFAETHNDTIDLQVIRKKHEYLITITNENLSMICDEETDHPIEREIPLSAFKDADEVFSEIRAFTERR